MSEVPLHSTRSVGPPTQSSPATHTTAYWRNRCRTFETGSRVTGDSVENTAEIGDSVEDTAAVGNLAIAGTADSESFCGTAETQESPADTTGTAGGGRGDVSVRFRAKPEQLEWFGRRLEWFRTKQLEWFRTKNGTTRMVSH